MGFANGFKKFSDIIDKICLGVIVAMLGVMVIVTTAQIICRTAGSALQWSEEVNRYLLIWSTFLGASCVYKAGTHISITFMHGLAFAENTANHTNYCTCNLYPGVLCHCLLWFRLCRKTGTAGTCFADTNEIYVYVYTNRIWVNDYSCH